MCGRYVIEDFQELSETLRNIPFQSTFDFKPNYNAAPTHHLPVIIERDGSLEMRPMQWGLIPSWLKPGEKPKVAPINARSETIAEKPMFRNLVKRNRCLVPANGFYEWKRTGGPKQPYLIHLKDEPIMLMAGLYSVRTDEEGDKAGSYTIITGGANELMGEIHDRMPMIIHGEDVELWLDDEIDEIGPLEHLLQPVLNEEIEMYPVSTNVNSVKNNSPDLIEPITVQKELL